MCQFKSGIISKTKVFFSEKTESHTEILSEFGLHQDGARGPNLVQFEIKPPNGDLYADFAAWVYKVDQDVLPPWYDSARDEARVRTAFACLFPKGITALTTLDAHGSKITDVSKLVNLTTLYADSSKITDVSKLVNCKVIW